MIVVMLVLMLIIAVDVVIGKVIDMAKRDLYRLAPSLARSVTEKRMEVDQSRTPVTHKKMATILVIAIKTRGGRRTKTQKSSQQREGDGHKSHENGNQCGSQDDGGDQK